MPEAISLKFGMWCAEGRGNLHSKICLVPSRQHRATEVRKLRFLSSCQYTHGVARRLLGPHDTLPCVLIPRNGIAYFVALFSGTERLKFLDRPISSKSLSNTILCYFCDKKTSRLFLVADNQS